MRTLRLDTQGDLTWPSPTSEVRSGHREWQVEMSSYHGIDFVCSNQLFYYIEINWILSASATSVKHMSIKTLYCRPWAVFMSCILLVYRLFMSASVITSFCWKFAFPYCFRSVITDFKISFDNLNATSMIISNFLNDWKCLCIPNRMLISNEQLYSSPSFFLISAYKCIKEHAISSFDCWISSSELILLDRQ
jgi:hypothetical protein